MQITAGRNTAAALRFSIDRLGVVIALILILSLIVQPFALLRPNRVAATAPVQLVDALPFTQAVFLMGLILITVALLVVRSPLRLRLSALIATLIAVAIAIGLSADYLTPTGNNYARVSPGGTVWLITFALALAIGDTLVRMRLAPLSRLAALFIFVALLGLFLYSGVWRDVSILKEYASRRDAFASALRTHALLAIGSLIAAFLIATPIGILIHRFKRLRDAVISFFNVIQTIPSMALFGVLIAPLAWVGIHMPGAAALGIAGIGPAPAFIALVAYALLPIVSATVTGLDNVSPLVVDAARGVGMTRRQRLLSIELPLAFPVILTGIRVVLVQNIGLAVIAGLVGGGGLGMFVFQGIAQTATDLVLLGALPTVAMAFIAAILLDALVEISRAPQHKEQTPMIEIANLTRLYGAQKAVDDVSLTVNAGEIVVIVGTSGSGKTTLMRMINRLVEPSAGVIKIDGKDNREVSAHILRRGIGYAIQGHGLFPHRSIAENIATVPRLLGWDRARIAARVDELLSLFHLDPAVYRDRMPHELSGGQQQRIGVARALASNPAILLMDEPFGALDPIIRDKAQEDLLAIQKHYRTTIVLVTHDMEEAIRLGTRIAVMDKGRLLQYATPQEIIARPATQFVHDLLGGGSDRVFRLLSLVTVDGLVEPGDANGDPIASDMSLREALGASLWSGRTALPVRRDGAIIGRVTRVAIEDHARSIA